MKSYLKLFLLAVLLFSFVGVYSLGASHAVNYLYLEYGLQGSVPGFIILAALGITLSMVITFELMEFK